MDNSFYLQVKGLSTEEFATRDDLVLALPDRIQDIPDGTAAAPKQTRGGWGASASHTEIKFDSGPRVGNDIRRFGYIDKHGSRYELGV
ncbi:Syntaxin-71 [Camellia lanceoleosa]|uniref:Syntaxin-71 n=1 Tax=Camellia lanceoleosa TaxID=1840588 RepID=A0ACC0G1W0_9ERIC|nr:Syntaxin-71 [Camellia lanceoleosa]